MKTGIPEAALSEAADWLLKTRDGLSEEEQQAFERWRDQHQDHRRAWARADRLRAMLLSLPADASHSLHASQRLSRRRVLSLLVLLGAGSGAGSLVWQHQGQQWLADFRTGYGQRQEKKLADGTLLVLNTATAVNVDISTASRHIHLLDGEIQIDTGKSPAFIGAPFFVHCAFAQLQALGTRFVVRQYDDRVALSVQEGQVRISFAAPSGDVVIAAGERAFFNRAGVLEQMPDKQRPALWRSGLMEVNNLSLAEFVEEIRRYTNAHIRLDPALADLRVSGTFSVDDIYKSLTLLELTHPVAVSESLFGLLLTINLRSG